VRIPAAELGRIAGVGEPATRVSITRTTSTGRVARIAVEGPEGKVVLDGPELRRRLGYDRLPSLAFEVKLARGTATFDGRGRGHGAGMCQWGAAGRARSGDGYAAILSRYYPGTQLTRMY
jgi:stage II sporulation protein D